MKRRLALSFCGVLVILLIPLLAVSQQQPEAVLVPPAARTRIPPPPPSASAAELESTGDELRGQKAYPDALDYYQAALNKQPSAELFNKIGIAQLQMTRYNEAKKSFKKAIKKDHTLANAYNNLGVIFYLEKKYKPAIKYYRKALALKEESASFHCNLGTAYFVRKEFSPAAAEFIRAMQLDPEVFERKSQAGVAAQMSSPEDRAHYSYVLAKMYAQVGNFDRSLTYLRKAMEDGYKGIDAAYKDPEFAALRKDARFEELMAHRPEAIPEH